MEKCTNGSECFLNCINLWTKLNTKRNISREPATGRGTGRDFEKRDGTGRDFKNPGSRQNSIF